MGKWPAGSALIWYPVKDKALVERFVARIADLAFPDSWRVEIDIGTARPEEAGLSACGLILVKPPWTLPQELEVALPLLADALARGPGQRGLCQKLG